MANNIMEILGLLLEECTDVIQLISKIKRSSLEDIYVDNLTNQQVLEQEISDIYLLVGLLIENKILDIDKIEAHVTRKAKDMAALAIQHAKNNPS